ncbi:MAG: hypothetical protein J5793_05150, partial [Clostridia bacterium]|nr:hypothetical protein [Clostridia bacterium]
MKKTLSVVLSIMMVIACCSALFTLTAQAAAPGFGWVDGWTSVDGTTKGSWQENKAAEGETAFTFDYACEAQNDAVYIGVKYYGALGGSASNFGNGKGMNIRLWFHDPNGTVAVWQYLMDISWNGAAFVSNFRPNGGSDIVSYGADPGTHYTLNTATTADGADLEVIIPVSEISASADVQVVISVSNNLGATLDTNRCLYHGCAYAVYNPWDSRPEACLYPTKPGFKLENVALGCSYTIPTNANNTYVYGSNNTAAADRAINSTLFTDGEYCTGNTEKTYLANCDTEVIIDLGERLTVYGFGAYATEGVWGVWLSHQLRIAYSDDGVNFTALTNGNNAAADARLFNENIGTVSGWTQNYTSVFASCAIAARYIKFTIPKGGYVWHDELTVLGQARPAILRPTHIGSYSAANMPLIPWTVAGSMQELIDNDNLTYVVEGYMSWADLGVFTWDNASKCYRMTEFISGLSGATKKDVVIPEYAFIAAVASYNNPNVAFLRGLELGDPVYVYGTALDTFTLYNWGEALNDSVTISDMPLDETIYGERYAPVATFSADGDFTDDVWEGAQWTEIGK